MRKLKNILPLLLWSVLWFGGCDKEDEIQYFLTDTDVTYEEETEQTTSALESENTLIVHVCGAVNHPGVVELEAQSRVVDAVNLAGGMTSEADTTYVNLAAKLKDGEKIYIPTVTEVSAWRTEQENEQFININSADMKELCTLPGIGESKAASIIAYREENGDFQSIEELMEVPGIKESLFLTLEGRISVK